MSKQPVTLEVGQVVNWPVAPDALAQVDELRRTKVRLIYRCKTGRLCRPVVSIRKLASVQDESPPPLPLFNLFGRGIARRRRKTFG